MPAAVAKLRTCSHRTTRATLNEKGARLGPFSHLQWCKNLGCFSLGALSLGAGAVCSALGRGVAVDELDHGHRGVVAVAILFYATSLTAMVPVMQDAMATAIRDGRMVLPDMASITRWTLVFLSVAIVLLAASVVRRLRDRGKSAAWALIPLALTAPSFVVTPNL